MKRIALCFEHKTSYASVDEAFAAYAAEAHKMDEPLANLGLSVWTDAENYAIGIKDSNDVIKPFLVMTYNKSPSYSDVGSYGISMLKDGSYTTTGGEYYQKLSSTDEYYTTCYPVDGFAHNYQFYPYIGQTYYTGQARQTLTGGEHRTVSTNFSPAYQNPYYLGNNASRFLQLIIYYNDDSAFFCTPFHSYNTASTSANDYYVTVTAMKKIGDKLWVIPRYSYDTSHTMQYFGQNGFYGGYFSSFSIYDENHPLEGAHTNTVSFGNRELDGLRENAVLSEVQIDSEGTTLGDAIYAGIVPAPNGRYLVNNVPYFFINGIGLKDPD